MACEIVKPYNFLLDSGTFEMWPEYRSQKCLRYLKIPIPTTEIFTTLLPSNQIKGVDLSANEVTLVLFLIKMPGAFKNLPIHLLLAHLGPALK